MTADLREEFKLLSAAASQYLKDIPARKGYRHVFSIWVVPSFSPSIRWTVYIPAGRVRDQDHRACALYSVWRSDLDSEKLRSPMERLKYPKDLVPSIEEESVQLTAEIVDEFEKKLRNISIPFFVQTSVEGLDGTSYEFRHDQFFFGGSLHWWENYPAEWRPFTEAVMAILTELNHRRDSGPRLDTHH